MEVCRIPQGQAAAAPYCPTVIIGDGLSGMAGMDWTPFAHVIGFVLLAVAIASGLPAALSIIVYLKSEATGETASTGRRTAQWIGVYAMVIIASVSGTGAGWLLLDVASR